MTSKTFLEKLNQTITVEEQSLINEFFVTFSRFEYALKASGFATGNNERVNPNWDAFTASIRDSFENENKSKSIQTAIKYLENNPPKIQTFIDDQLGWRERTFQPNEPLINRISLSIRDVRNNFFHGGKFNGNYQEDVSRNFLLLKHSIRILNFWLELSNPVRERFSESIV